jgi:hypothetical protein
MEGLFLRSKLSMENIIVDNRVLSFSQLEKDEDALEQKLEESRRTARSWHLCRTFSFSDELSALEAMHMELLKTKTGPKEEHMKVLQEVVEVLDSGQKHAENFHKQIRALATAGEDSRLEERTGAGTVYFSEKVLAPCVKKIEDHLSFLNSYTKALKQKRIWKDIHTQLKEKSAGIKALRVGTP